MLKSGMIIAERYEIVSRIGSGGMADVYKALDHKLNRNVAVKVLKAEFREDTNFIQKFKREAQAAAGLTHPNIVNVFDVGDDDGVYYIVMELIEGITLKDYISKKGKLSIKEATSIAIQVSMGLEAAHSHSVVHRDVKPQNIIISKDGEVKVTDFGIARAASANTISSNAMGSVHYSSPEQVRGGYSDEKSDIYSLGITIYEMVTGRVPFDGDTTVSIAIKHLQESMVPPSVYTEELPYSLEQIIFKCTQKSVARRYERMEDLIADLKHSLIDPQGDFVKITPAKHDGKTVVISDEELGAIKNKAALSEKRDYYSGEDPSDGEEAYDDYYSNTEEDMQEKERSAQRRKKNQRKRRIGRLISILAMLLGAAVLVAIILVIGKAAGLIGGRTTTAPDTVPEQVVEEEKDNGMAIVPDLVGKTEAEAKTLASAQNLGVQLLGEELSGVEKGLISSQSIAAGTEVAENSTIQYYISGEATTDTVPDVSYMNFIDAQQTLTEQGFAVSLAKEYCSADENGYPLVEPGYVLSTQPAGGEAVVPGAAVTMVVSRGLDQGSAYTVPSVVGDTRDNALITLGKFLTINVVEQADASAPSGEVIGQSPAGGEVADPNGQITITVAVNDGSAAPADATAAGAADAATAAAGTTDAAGNPVITQPEGTDGSWKCTQTLGSPEGYSGGPIRLELLQEVNGLPQASVILEGQTIAFPYDLDLNGVTGLTSGTLVVYEADAEGIYTQLGEYPLTFEPVA